MEYLSHISIEQHHIGTKLELSLVLTPNASRKVVLGAHLIVLVVILRFLIHILAFHAESRIWH